MIWANCLDCPDIKVISRPVKPRECSTVKERYISVEWLLNLSTYDEWTNFDLVYERKGKERIHS